MKTIIKGTNAVIRYVVPNVDFAQIGNIEMHIYQCGRDIVKTREDLVIVPEVNMISYTLTQEESLALMPKGTVEISVILMLDGKRRELRPIITAEVELTRKGEVMT